MLLSAGKLCLVLLQIIPCFQFQFDIPICGSKCASSIFNPIPFILPVDPLAPLHFIEMRFSRPRLRVSQHESAFASGNARWTNRDLDPIPLLGRKWGVASIIGKPLSQLISPHLTPSTSPIDITKPNQFLAYWISDAFNAATWEFASSIIAVGLTYKEALVIVAISFFIISFVIAGNGTVGAKYHIPFPVIARVSWGFWGSYIPIVSRVILAVFWFAIQNINGGNAVRVMLGAIWPSYLNLHNGIPLDQGITTNGMVAYFIFWVIQFPFLCLHPNKLRWLFAVKSIIVPIAFIAILVWAFVAEKGGGAIFDNQSASVSGSKYSWLFLANMTSVLGNYATLSVNQVSFHPLNWDVWDVYNIPSQE